MNQYKFLMKVSLFFFFILVVLSCTTNKGANNTETEFSFIAEGTSEGIALHFNNIPEDTIALSVYFLDIAVNNYLIHQVLFWNTDLLPEPLADVNVLAKLKETKSLLCPFAKNGQEYTVTVGIFTDETMDDWMVYTTNVIANGGIYQTNNPSLFFTDENRILTLSEKPTFSEEVEYSQKNIFSYGVKVILDDGRTPGGSRDWNEFFFPAHEIYNGSQEYFGFTGKLPVIGLLRVNLIHENIEWIVGVAETEEVAILF